MNRFKYLQVASIAIVMVTVIFFSCKKQGNSGPDMFNTVNAKGEISEIRQVTTTCSGDTTQHFITIDYAYALIRNYQNAVKNGTIAPILEKGGWVYTETFPAEVIQKVISQTGCCSFRIYNGLDDGDNRLHLVLVGVNQYGSDILYCKDAGAGTRECEGIGDLSTIVEMGATCPHACARIATPK